MPGFSEGEVDRLRQTLRSLRPFGDEHVGLSEKEIESCLMASEPVDFEQGRCLFKQGDPAGECFFIANGRVAVYRTVAECSCGKEITETLESYVDSGCIGLHSLVCGCARIHTATAQTYCKCFRLTRKRFQKVLKTGGPLRAIQRVPELAGYSLEEQRAVAAAVERLKVARGTKLLRRNCKSGGLYFMESGEATCLTNDGVCVKLASNPPMWRYGPGDYFGEETLCFGVASSAEVSVSSEFATIYFLRKEAFHEIIPAHGKQRFGSVWVSRQLSKSEAFADLSPKQLEEIAKSKASIECYDDGELIFTTDVNIQKASYVSGIVPAKLSPTDVIIVSEGAVVFKQRLRTSPRSSLFTNKILGRIEAGDCFSFSSVFSNGGESFQDIIIAETAGRTVLVAAQQEAKRQNSALPRNHSIPTSPKRLKRGSKWDTLTILTQCDESGFVRTPTKNPISSSLRTCSPRKRSTGVFASDRSLVLSLESLETLDVLGHGAFGTVRLVRHRNTNHLYALKHMDKSRIERHNYEKRVYREKEILAIVGQHPFVASLIRTFRDSTAVYLLLEACLGGDLFSLVERKERQVLTIDEIRFFGAQIVLALEHIHDKGVVYRDLKPENVIISGDGYLRLTDFGMAKELSCSSRTNTFCGTPAFIAPEVFCRTGHNQMVDWWALGILLYEVSMGRFPFDSESVSSMRTSLQNYAQAYPDHGVFLGMEFANIDPTCIQFVRELLHPDPRLRAGDLVKEQIKGHPIFCSNVDWEALLRREAKPPPSVIKSLKTWQMPKTKRSSINHSCGDCRRKQGRKRSHNRLSYKHVGDETQVLSGISIPSSNDTDSQLSLPDTQDAGFHNSWDFAF